MSYIPELTPLTDASSAIHLSVLYEKRFTTVDDATHDDQHIHDFYELYVNLAGDVSFLVENNLYPIRRGDAVLTAPNELHRCIYHSDGVHEHFCIWLKDIPFASPSLQDQFSFRAPVILSDKRKQELIDLCFALHQSLSADESGKFRAIASLAGILDLIANHRGETPPEGVKLPESFSKIVDYILAHYVEPSCNVATLCQVFYISKSTLCRKFQQYFQMTPSNYIESKRFSEAKKLLAEGLSVQDVCSASGFLDCSYFIMRFRKRFGVTPYKYQKTIL